MSVNADFDPATHGLPDWQRTIFDRALQFVVGHTSEATEGAYIYDLVQFLSRLLHADFVFCNVISEADPENLETVAMFHNGEYMESFSCGLQGTPCGEIVGREPGYFASRVQELFPDDDVLGSLNAESYAGVPLWAADGSPLGVIGIINTAELKEPAFLLRVLQLVAARVSAEVERLRNSRTLNRERQRFADFAEISSDWFWEKDENLRFCYFSERFELITGVKSAELLGKTREETGAPGSDPAAYRKLLQTLENREPFRNFVHHRIHPDGHTVYLSISGMPVFEQDGTFMGYRGVGRDVTHDVEQSRELTRLATEAEARRRTMSKVMNGIPALIAYVDTKYRYIIGNQAYGDWFGISVDDLFGRPVKDMHSEELYNAIKPYFDRGLAGETVDVFLSLERLESEQFELEGVVEPERDEIGTVTGCYIFLDDVTERVAAEKTARDAELSARRSDKAKSQFLANMSHELRSPLNAIIGFSELMAAEQFGPLDTKYLEYSKGIGSASRHLLAVISDILDLSKIEANALELEEDVLVVQSLVNDALTIARPLADARNQSLVTELRPGSKPVLADERLLRQVLVNLLSNAIKFSPKGETITVQESRDGDGALILLVIDNGVGIRNEDLARVFEPFGQIKNDPMIAQEGIGLGLSLSRKIMEMHGGELTLKSADGEGTIARMTLPASRTVLNVLRATGTSFGF